MENYKILEHIGDGAHGHVIKGYNRKTNKVVALKKILARKNKDEIPVNILREIKILLTVESEYVSIHFSLIQNTSPVFCPANDRNSNSRLQVIQLLDYFPYDFGVVLVFEFMPTGLYEILHDCNYSPSIPQIKAYMVMLLKGIAHLHENGIMHRVIQILSIQ